MKFQIEFPRALLSLKRSVSFGISISLANFTLIPLFAQELGRNNVSKSETSSKLELKPENGPWLLFATSFDGEDAKNQAEQLAIELRRDFKLQAYWVAKKIDFTQPVIGAGIDENGRTRRMKVRGPRVIDGYAVFVGDFDSIDSPTITDTLAKIKQIVPKSLQVSDSQQQDFSKTGSVSVNTWRDFLKKKNDLPGKPGPMPTAFATRNPLLPADFYKTPEVDRFVKELNQKREYSEFNLLDNPGKFTVRVAVFSSDEKGIGSWGGSTSRETNDEQKVSQLELAGERAALTTKALRKAGYEAYQFHDRTQSIVTVGSFNELGKNDQTNRFTYDSGIRDIAVRFGGTGQQTRTHYGVSQTPKVLFDLVDQKLIPELNEGSEKSKLKWFTKHSIPFDLSPKPIAVPKPTVYSGSLLGSNRP